jgi:hypothetical protein
MKIGSPKFPNLPKAAQGYPTLAKPLLPPGGEVAWLTASL